MIFIDANVFAYALLGPERNALHAEAARNFLDELVRGKHEAVTSSLVLDELMWVLWRHGKQKQVTSVIEHVYAMPHLRVERVGAKLPLSATRFMDQYGLRPRDALHCAFMQELGVRTIVSTDADFDRVKQFKRIRL